MHDLITRQFEFQSTPARAATRADDDAGPPILYGYGAVFNSPTRIDSWEGKFDEIIAPGAFKKTLNERTPVLQFDHGHHPVIGSLPIGRFDKLVEDKRGLYVEAELFESPMTDHLIQAIRGDTIGGMSFRFRVIREELDESSEIPLRTIQEVALYEVGPVVFPAYADTMVGVRALVDALPSEQRDELATILRTPTLAAQPGTREGVADTADPPAVTATGPQIPISERLRLLALTERLKP
jgi:uncharacterized protein